MIIVGLDFGDARTGVAVCDKYEMMATDAGCVAADSYKKALAAVAERVKELKAELIVVGNPINMDGSQGFRSEKCKAFARELSELTGIPTEMYDERLTTVSAHKLNKRTYSFINKVFVLLCLNEEGCSMNRIE